VTVETGREGGRRWRRTRWRLTVDEEEEDEIRRRRGERHNGQDLDVSPLSSPLLSISMLDAVSLSFSFSFPSLFTLHTPL